MFQHRKEKRVVTGHCKRPEFRGSVNEAVLDGLKARSGCV